MWIESLARWAVEGLRVRQHVVTFCVKIVKATCCDATCVHVLLVSWHV